MKRRKTRRPPLTIAQILAWADAHFRRTGKWPTSDSGPIIDAPGETWCGVDTALKKGLRGLRAGSSLARLLAATGRKWNPRAAPRLTEQEIAAWAEAQFRCTGRWPNRQSGPVLVAPGEKWHAIHDALANGYRGLPGGTTLARLLRRHRYLLLQSYVPIRAQWAMESDQHSCEEYAFSRTRRSRF